MENTKDDKQYTEYELFIFLDAVINACKNGKRGKEFEFVCPLCGGHAIAYISTSNSHKHAVCNKCKITLCS